jgi:hypothetical protein
MSDSAVPQVGKRLRSDPNFSHFVRLFAQTRYGQLSVDSIFLSLSLSFHHSLLVSPSAFPTTWEKVAGNLPKSNPPSLDKLASCSSLK